MHGCARHVLRSEVAGSGADTEHIGRSDSNLRTGPRKCGLKCPQAPCLALCDAAFEQVVPTTVALPSPLLLVQPCPATHPLRCKHPSQKGGWICAPEGKCPDAIDGAVAECPNTCVEEVIEADYRGNDRGEWVRPLLRPLHGGRLGSYAAAWQLCRSSRLRAPRGWQHTPPPGSRQQSGKAAGPPPRAAAEQLEDVRHQPVLAAVPSAGREGAGRWRRHWLELGERRAAATAALRQAQAAGPCRPDPSAAPAPLQVRFRCTDGAQLIADREGGWGEWSVEEGCSLTWRGATAPLWGARMRVDKADGCNDCTAGAPPSLLP